MPLLPYDLGLKRLEQERATRKIIMLQTFDERRKGEREEWLADFGVKESDVLMKDDGTEFIYSENEGENGETLEIYAKKIELPIELQAFYTPF